MWAWVMSIIPRRDRSPPYARGWPWPFERPARTVLEQIAIQAAQSQSRALLRKCQNTRKRSPLRESCAELCRQCVPGLESDNPEYGTTHESSESKQAKANPRGTPCERGTRFFFQAVASCRRLGGGVGRRAAMAVLGSA